MFIVQQHPDPSSGAVACLHPGLLTQRATEVISGCHGTVSMSAITAAVQCLVLTHAGAALVSEALNGVSMTFRRPSSRTRLSTGERKTRGAVAQIETKMVLGVCVCVCVCVFGYVKRTL